MITDNWLDPDVAATRLRESGYTVAVYTTHLNYRRPGVSGTITVHKSPFYGVDGVAIARLEDRGS